MENKEKNRELIENMVKQSPGFKSNQDLLEEMINESFKRLESFLENSDDSTSEVYIKKIVSSAVVDTIKNKAKIREEKAKQAEEISSFEEVQINYKTNQKGEIVYEIELEKPDETAQLTLSEKKIGEIKEKLGKLENESPSKNYRKIFELRFLKEMSYKQIAKELESGEKETLKTLQDIYKEITPSLTTKN